jgi:hypothetical protein
VLNSQSLIGVVSIFSHSDRYYALTAYYPGEFGDGVHPRIEIMLDELMWNDEIK